MFLYLGPGVGIGTIVLVIIVLVLVVLSFFLIAWTSIKRFYRKLFKKDWSIFYYTFLSLPFAKSSSKSDLLLFPIQHIMPT